MIHFGKNNSNYEYYLNDYKTGASDKLGSQNSERDLGIIISNDLKWKNQVLQATNRANTILGMIKRTFRYKSIETIKTLYTALVRPHLEYAVQVWSPYLKSDIDKLEQVQRRATKLVPAVKPLEYSERLERFNLTTLEERRIRGDVIQQYKILKGIDKINWFHPQTFKKKALNTRSHSYSIERQIVKNCEQRYQFFSNRTTTYWNQLSNETINQETTNKFKNKFDNLYFKNI